MRGGESLNRGAVKRMNGPVAEKMEKEAKLGRFSCCRFPEKKS